METFLKAWQALPNFSGRASLKTWLYRMTHNCAIDMIRKSRRRRETELPTEDRSEDGPVMPLADEAQETPGDAMVRNERCIEVRRALEQLPEDHRVTLQLRYADEMSYADIAAATGVSIGTVMSRIFNGKRKLRRRLEAESTHEQDTME
jgi:RNA polymerase sigma-70 factor (ECF subfamily)